MQQFIETNTSLLSIAQVDLNPQLAYSGSTGADADVLALEEASLAAVVARVGDVEAAEWALDQAKAAFDVQVAAALSAGVPAEKVALAAGTPVSVLPAAAVDGPGPAAS